MTAKDDGKTDDARRPLVLASSAATPEDVVEMNDGRRPRLDYLVTAEALGADVLDTRISQGLPPWRRKIERALASDLAQAQAAWNRRGTASAWLSVSEKVGLPLALRGNSGVPHVLIAHNLMTGRKRGLHKLTGVLSQFDAIICLSQEQAEFVQGLPGVIPERVHFVFDNVDDAFFRPASDAVHGDYLLAVGRENRDYPTLIEAARRLDVPLTIVSSSLWSSHGLSVDAGNLPSNVTLRTDFVSYPELRRLYENARLVVVPLASCDYAAGVNGALEAMAMAKAAVVSQTRGLEGYSEDGVSSRLVPPGDVEALAGAIHALWDDDATRQTLGIAARKYVETEMSMDGYARRVAQIVRQVIKEN